ncbi:MAG: FKBP-type peptidyl-prolyl cis-trans isomerase, partial [Nanoarchaeota archaeon]|nr:FKBP-type peptidyl-prolyl cis-trans isomerase [Nanoarchaeota archaeon]
LRSPQIFLSSMLGKPTSVITMKDVATKSIWPNVLTTVAEFNESSMTSVIGQMGGGFIFWLALSGIVLLLVNKKKFEPINVAYLIGSLLYYAFVIHFNSTMNTAMKFIIVLSIPIIIGIIKIIALKEEVDHLGIALLILIWVLGTGYGFTKGIRFAILMVPAIAIGFGITAGLIYQFVAKWIGEGLSINKMLSKASVLAVLALLLVSPIISADKVARQEIPSMNDAWYDSLRGITDDSEDAIITSWWDFGHWFVTVAERRVTFDGGDQKRRIHWVGRTLLENDEDIAIGILRMLNCGQEYGFDKLNEFVGDQLKTYNLMIELVVLDGEQAMQKLLDYGLSEDQANEVLVLTHCEEIIPQYYITSQDMIGKSGVWAHFGSWDFKKASMYNQVNDEDYAEGTTILKEKFNLSEDSADTIYYEIQNTAADKWVSGWPSYRSGLASCSVQGNTAKCSDGVEVDLETYDVKFTGQSGTPYSIVYATKEGIVEKKFENPAIPITVALVPNGDSYKSIFMDPELSQSIFTKLFFFNGHGTTHFSLLSDKTTINGEKVQVWKVNFDGQEPLMLEQFMDKKDKVVKSGDEVSVGYIGYLKNGTIFDSSIIGWQELGITANSGFTGYEMNQFTFTVGAGQVIPGFNDAVIGMKINQTKVVEIPPEYAYGTDPAAHPLGNQTLGFKMILLDIK